GTVTGTKKTPGTLTVFPAFGIIRRLLEREVDTGPGHPEIVIGARDDVPAHVVDPAAVRRKANFKTTADLTDQLRLSVIELSSNRAEVAADRTEEKVMITTATEDAAAAEPEIRREARAADREAQGEGAENA